MTDLNTSTKETQKTEPAIAVEPVLAPVIVKPIKDNEENLKAMPNDRDFEVLFDDGTILNFSDEDFPFAEIIAWREIACAITCIYPQFNKLSHESIITI